MWDRNIDVLSDCEKEMVCAQSDCDIGSIGGILLSDYVGDVKHVKCVNKEKIGWIASPAKKEKVYEKENIYQKVVCF